MNISSATVNAVLQELGMEVGGALVIGGNDCCIRIRQQWNRQQLNQQQRIDSNGIDSNGIFETSIERVYNLITLSPNAHVNWNRGAFALKLISMYDNNTTLKVKSFWQKKQKDIKKQ
jgi:hypothetical protein